MTAASTAARLSIMSSLFSREPSMRRRGQNPRFRLASAKPIATPGVSAEISSMDFTLSDEQRAFQETARQFARDEWLPHAPGWDAREEFPRSEEHTSELQSQ